VIILRAGVVRIDFYSTEICVSVFLAGGPEGPETHQNSNKWGAVNTHRSVFRCLFIYNIAFKVRGGS